MGIKIWWNYLWSKCGKSKKLKIFSFFHQLLRRVWLLKVQVLLKNSSSLLVLRFSVKLFLWCPIETKISNYLETVRFEGNNKRKNERKETLCESTWNFVYFIFSTGCIFVGSIKWKTCVQRLTRSKDNNKYREEMQFRKTTWTDFSN